MGSSSNERFATYAVVDTNGLLRGQKIAAGAMEGIFRDGVGMAPAQLALDPTDVFLDIPGVTDDTANFHDATLTVDESSRREMPWEKPGDGALYLAHFTGDPGSFCPRSVLSRVMERGVNIGLMAKYGYEQEFTLFNETHKTLVEKDYDNLETATPHPSHDLLIYQSLQSDFYGAVADICEPLGISLGKMHEEIGGGFMEACIDAGEGLEPAHQAVLLKNFIRILAMKRGQSVCYMPRWSEEADSQSTHIHVSLKSPDGKPIFWDETDPENMSQTFKYFIGGLQKYLPETMLILAPTVNAWRRFAEGTFAPASFSWGIENRTCCFRVVGNGPGSIRVENRLPGSDTNPYLSLAATLAAGFAGGEEKLDPTEPTTGNGYLPGVSIGAVLLEGMGPAIEALKASDHAKSWFNPRFVEAYTSTRASQLSQLPDDDLIAERKRFFELG